MSPSETVESWFRQYGDDIYRFLVYFKGTHDVEDLLQETFLRAIRALHQYQSNASPKTWLLKIARNLAIDDGRKKKATPLTDEHLRDLPSSEASPESSAVVNEMRQELMTLLQDLDAKHRDVLIWRCLYDFSFRQIADLAGCNEVTARSRYHRAKHLAEERLSSMRNGGILA